MPFRKYMITPFICPKLRVSQNIECIRATQKESAIEQQQHSRETVICQRHETILRLLSSAATASTRW